ncbi:hypothetical protein DL546_003260 [Coniochaeta pulveracea]|uniref:F-box domain-containing protein n=1 Tax=Coniochaeta pulveracea TaxID=177199 RepID=A0A420XZ71_9PEZI|nr:hypothetical protein DL546_003260 [Coniochaeta pulveracea]
MASFLSPFRSSRYSNDEEEQQAPLRSVSGQSLQGLDVDMSNASLDDQDRAALHNSPRNGMATQAINSQQDVAMEGFSFDNVNAPAWYSTQPFPTSVKRKRYSVSLDYPADNDFLNIPKARNNHSSATPLVVAPEIGRKASERIEAMLYPSEGDTTPKFDMIGKISSSIDILVNVSKFLRPKDILNLYSISRDFHATLDGNLQSSVVHVANHICPLAAQVYPHQFYTSASKPDPAGRPRNPAYHDIYARLRSTPGLPSAQLPDPGAKVRKIPSLVWLTMVHSRHTRVRDILASLARQGHRVPKGTYATLLKLWLVMDMPTNEDRALIMKTRKFISRFDLYRASMFLVKMCLRMNDPLYGPDHMELLKLMLGQRGLSPLWKLLRGKQYTTYSEILHLKMRYNVEPTPTQLEAGRPICGVPVEEMGKRHLEGWGLKLFGDWDNPQHLLRLDELITRECARRGLNIEPHMQEMMLYGHVDIAKGKELVPTLDELYMSDEDYENPMPVEEQDPHEVVSWSGCGNVPFGDNEWTPKLARKGVWDDLTDRERELILEVEKDEMLKSLAWEMDSEDSLEEDEDDGEEGADEDATKEEKPAEGKGKAVDIPKVVVQDSNLDSHMSFDMPSPSLQEQDPVLDQRRVLSTDSLSLPQLRKSSRVTSVGSSILLTPQLHPNDSPAFNIHQRSPSYAMSDVSDLDLGMDEESTILAESSLHTTPKARPSPQPPSDDGYEGDEEKNCREDGTYDEDEGDCTSDETDGEDTQDGPDDDELRAQAFEDYSESEFEYDWDGFMEECQWEKEAQAGPADDGAAEEKLRQYQPRF